MGDDSRETEGPAGVSVEHLRFKLSIIHATGVSGSCAEPGKR
jgi:hypothetical protein